MIYPLLCLLTPRTPRPVLYTTLAFTSLTAYYQYSHFRRTSKDRFPAVIPFVARIPMNPVVAFGASAAVCGGSVLVLAMDDLRGGGGEVSTGVSGTGGAGGTGEITWTDGDDV